MRKCQKCGTEYPNNYNYCENGCGKLPGGKNIISENQMLKRFFGVLFLVSVIAVGAAFYLYIKVQKDDLSNTEHENPMSATASITTPINANTSVNQTTINQQNEIDRLKANHQTEINILKQQNENLQKQIKQKDEIIKEKEAQLKEAQLVEEDIKLINSFSPK